MTRKKNPDTSQILKIALIGVGAYILWEYVIAPMMAAPTAAPGAGTTVVVPPAGTNVLLTQPVTTATSSPTGVSLPPVVTGTAPPPTSALKTQLLNAAASSGLSSDNVTADQWSYFYQNQLGRPVISPTTYAAMMGSIGAGGPQVVSVDQFIQALGSQGLSGIVRNIPSMTFGHAFKGFRAPMAQKGQWVN